MLPMDRPIYPMFLVCVPLDFSFLNDFNKMEVPVLQFLGAPFTSLFGEVPSSKYSTGGKY